MRLGPLLETLILENRRLSHFSMRNCVFFLKKKISLYLGLNKVDTQKDFLNKLLLLLQPLLLLKVVVENICRVIHSLQSTMHYLDRS